MMAMLVGISKRCLVSSFVNVIGDGGDNLTHKPRIKGDHSLKLCEKTP